MQETQPPSVEECHPRPTIKDVAAAAGVSLATVSNVVNGKSASVGDKTRKRVLKAIERLGYRPQSAGRRLRTARRHSVALVIVDESEAYLADGFAANMVPGFTDTLNRRGYSAVIHGCRRAEFGKSVVVQNLEVDAYCLFLSGTPDERRSITAQIQALHQPVVLVEETTIPQSSEFASVRQDDFGGGRLLADHLLARSARDILFVLPELSWPAIEARVAGMRDGVRSAGSGARLKIVTTPSEKFDEVMAALDRYLEANPQPNAIACANDQMGIAAMQVLEARGMLIPADVMVTGFNGFEYRRYARPLLTTIKSSAREIGVAAAEALIHRIEHGHFKEKDTLLPTSLLPGGST
ncbi:MAG: LacI family transcriptional regulator [Sphingopyxis sp.]|nr:LacI family transcriptional regulator [Sphingopyxis sp.]